MPVPSGTCSAGGCRRRRARIRAGERLPFGEGPPAVKVVLSLREDHLGNLEEFAAELPGVLENRFRLTALDRNAARAAIVEPAGLAQGAQLASPPLRFTDDALSELLAFLEGRSGVIEPFQLQVLCSHLEQQGMRRSRGAPAEEVTIDRPDLGGRKGMEGILGNFYRDALDALPGRGTRRYARNLCEWGLLSQEGRRLPMERAEIRRQFRVDADTLDLLVDARRLRSEPRLEGVFYELSHDTLGEAVLEHRRWRLPRRVKYALLGLVIALALAGWGWYERGHALAAKRAADAHAQKAVEAENLIEFMTFDLLAKLQPLGKLELLRDAQQRVDAYYELLGVLEDNPDVMRRRAVNLFNSGDLQRALGDLGAAERLYGEGAQVLARLADADPEDTDRRRDLTVSLERVGDIKAAQGDLSGALVAYDEGKVIRERLAASDPSNVEWQRDVVVSLWKLSGEGLAEPAAASGYLARALEILEGLDAQGKLHGEHRDWPDLIRRRLETLGQ